MGISSEPPKRLEGKKCFKCHCYSHFQADFPSAKNLTISEVEEIQALDKETSEEEFDNEDHTLVTLDVGDLFVIQGAFYVKDFPLKPNQQGANISFMV